MSVSTFDESKIKRDGSGQFAEKPAAPESGVALAEPSHNWDPETGVSPEDLLEMSRKSAAYMARRYQVDPDELAAEAVVYYLNQVANGARQGTLRLEDERKTQAHIRAITKGLAQRIASGHKHGGPNLTAVTAYLKKREEFESSTGQKMTSGQEDALATSIRDGWEGTRKPDISFHRARSLNGDGNVSLDAVRTEYEGTEASGIFGQVGSAEETHLADDTEFEKGSVGASAEDLAASKVAADRHEAKRALWSVLASTHSAPELRRGSVSEADADRMRSDVASHGSVDTLVAKFDRGEMSEAESDALFAPWGEDGRRGDAQERIVDTLTTRRPMAGDIWDAAVFTVTKAKATRARK